MSLKKIKSALISVYNKDNLAPIINLLPQQNIKIYSTGGTQSFIEAQGVAVTAVEKLTGYPSILGGRVKTLHPKIFGGILARRANILDINDMAGYDIPEIDLVIVDLYPFEETVRKEADHDHIIEKIDIGGISLIRAAAKNYQDTVVVPSQQAYGLLLEILQNTDASTTLEQRRFFSAMAFETSSHYDTQIYQYVNNGLTDEKLKLSIQDSQELRYGENPHQKARFFGKIEDTFEMVSGKAISYNNLLDIDAAVNLIADFDETTFAILKHNNACGVASREGIFDAWKAALAGDPVSAFGGILITNGSIDLETAKDIDKLFYEVLIAADFSAEALELLTKKAKRTILKIKQMPKKTLTYRSVLDGILVQEKDLKVESIDDLNVVTQKSPPKTDLEDMQFANKIVKHTKSNAIVLAKNKQLIGSGMGQTSRIDAMKQAVHKAKSFGFDVTGSILASDAFFPFADSVEVAHKEGIKTIIQPGGSIRDQESIDYCNQHSLSMVFTGTRHFKH